MTHKTQGVNLGGWLVLERWIRPGLFRGFKARDETALCRQLGKTKAEKLSSHHRNFIKENDFRWIAERGLNAVRIPVGYWIFGDVEPYIGSIVALDWAVETAEKYDIQVLIDLHAAPGSQNGLDHSGLIGEAGWHRELPHIEQSLRTISRLAKRYSGQSNIIGIELLNEPHWDTPTEILRSYYLSAYRQIRENLGDKAVVISDTFKPALWQQIMTEPDYPNVILDSHLYQCFTEEDKKLTLEEHLKKTHHQWRPQIKQASQLRPVIIGEWSLGLAPQTFKGMTKEQKISAYKAYSQAQLAAFNGADGWFFWTYKTEAKGGWNFRHCVESGLLPDSFASAG